MSDTPAPVANYDEYERKRRDLEQLRACRTDMAAAIAEHIDWLLEMEANGHLRSAEDMAREPFGIAEANARAREPIHHDPGTDPVTGRFDPTQVSWNALANLLEHEPEQGREVWLKIKAEARQELATGVRAADALQGPIDSRRPWQRAQFLAIVDSLTRDLQPRGALEALMIQRMASTLELCLMWQKLAIERHELEEWQAESKKREELGEMTPRQRERSRYLYGYLPPRLSKAEAIEQAFLMGDRYERAFLRLVREFRNARRMFAALIVAEGGTVNVSDGPQQVNIDARSNAKPRGKQRADRGTSISDNRR